MRRSYSGEAVVSDLADRIRAVEASTRQPSEIEAAFAELVDAQREWMDGKVRNNERLSRAWGDAYRLRPIKASGGR